MLLATRTTYGLSSMAHAGLFLAGRPSRDRQSSGRQEEVHPHREPFSSLGGHGFSDWSDQQASSTRQIPAQKPPLLPLPRTVLHLQVQWVAAVGGADGSFAETVSVNTAGNYKRSRSAIRQNSIYMCIYIGQNSTECLKFGSNSLSHSDGPC